MQLSAIFKLEFYKHKKDWKLSRDGTERSKNPSPSSKNTDKQYKTYSVGEESSNPKFDGEPVSPDNKVSSHKEPDKTPDPQLPDIDTPELEVQHLPEREVRHLSGPEGLDFTRPEVLDLPGPEVLDLPGLEVLDLFGSEVLDLPGPEVLDLPGSEALDLPGSESLDHNLYRLHPRCQPNSGDRAEALGQDTQLTSSQPYWQDQCEIETAEILAELVCDLYDGPGQHYLEPSGAGSHEWLQKGYSLYKDKFTSLYDEDQGLPELEIHVFEPPMPPPSEDMSCSIEVPTQVMSELMDDTADFMRGAHLALHSSEIDLNITEECSCFGEDKLWSLSMKQLARVIRRHEVALALLLQERARRSQLSTLSTHYQFPFEVCDTNRLRPPDGIRPGSHCAPSGSDGTGRGRGRLQQARKQYNKDAIC